MQLKEAKKLKNIGLLYLKQKVRIAMNNTLTALKGVMVGHSTHLDKLSGCTLVVFDEFYPMAYKSYGGSPGTFNTDVLQDGKSFYEMNGVFVSGGSWEGLMTSSEIIEV
jgi:L-aminopeptidase/D-esterase-like protein